MPEGEKRISLTCGDKFEICLSFCFAIASLAIMLSIFFPWMDAVGPIALYVLIITVAIEALYLIGSGLYNLASHWWDNLNKEDGP